MKHTLSSWGLAFLLFACTEETKLEPPLEETSFSAPEIFDISTLQDSLKPKSISLKNLPQPRVIQVPEQDGGSYTFQDENGETQNFPLLAPAKQDLLVLKNENGEIILSPEGKPYLLGEGGVSQFKTYSTDDGLALDAVNCAILDSRGHLWFGTNGGGVSRYDGNTFTNFTSAQGLSGNILRSMLEDSKGNIWFGTISGVSKYDGYTFTNFSREDGLADDGVFSILEDKNGHLWFGTGGGGVSKFDGEKFTTLTTEDGLADNFVISILEDGEGNLYFGTYGGGFSKYDGKSFQNFSEHDGLPGNRVRSFTLSNSGKIWIGTIGGGASLFDGKTFTNYSIKDGLAGDIVRTIVEDSQGNAWFATETGISRYDGEKFTTYTRNQGMPSNSVLSIVKDASGKLWFCTDGGGVSRFEGSSFTNFSVAQGLGNNLVLSTLEDKDGNLWFGTAGGGVSKFDGKSFITYSTSQGLGSDIVNSMIQDQSGNFWFGTGGGGVSKFDGKVFTTYTTAHTLGVNEIYSIAEDHLGNLWFGSEGGGLSKFDGENFTRYTTDHGLAGNVILSILEDSENQLWIGAVDGGISRFDGTKFTNFTTSQGLVDNAVIRIKEDLSGNIWVGTEHGLSFLSKDELSSLKNSIDTTFSFQSFGTKDGLPDNLIQQIVPMKNGKIAVGTNLGFIFFDAPKANQPFNKLENIEIFNSNTGFPVKDLTDGQNGMYQDSKGILWAGTGSNKTALVRFDYRELARNQKAPKIFLKQIRINEEVIPWHTLADNTSPKAIVSDELNTFGKELFPEERDSLKRRFKGISFEGVSPFYSFPENLVLPYRHNHINIDFGSDELAKPYLVEYQYILEGYDEEWSPVLRKTSATFGNIHEGEYTFLVKARFTGPAEGQAGEWTEPIAYRFSVLPPLYRTWWAYAFYTLLFLSLIYPIHRIQRNKAIQAEQEKARERELEQAREIEKAYTKLESAHENLKATQNQLIQQEKLASLGQLTAGIAHEIKNPLNFVNNFSGLSLEFLEEIEEELQKMEPTDSLENVKDLLADIKTNLNKIKHHGGRADGIVKSMLMHSRGGSGAMEPSDLNEVIREYVNLSFHGMRANKNPINVDIILKLDESLPKIPLNMEDFSRVILNLTKNAFDAMREKINNVGPEYQAKLEVRTKNLGENILIEVEDNGPGVPEEIKDKLLMPFFTTKKGTEGTGLGLSITHDIIKAHNGSLEITSKVGEWTRFSITIPKTS
ncbi:MAG TPA: two-component regulator propeller domain-containing protein [Algoriphagus sp.]|nr:two-component regulator propeller domain-containing protein [Algoriphagus sp.]